MKHLWKAALGVGFALLATPHAQAQLAVAKVVATCGTVSPTPHAGSTYALTIDITGTLCTVGGGSGGGGTSSNFGAAFPGAGTAAGFEYLTSAPTLTSGQMVAGQTDVNGNLKVNVVSGGGSVGGFTPSSSGARMTPLSVVTTVGGSNGPLPTGAVVVISNTDTTNPVYCNANGVSATIADQKIPANSWFAFTIPGSVSTLNCIATGATVVVNGVGGSGLPTGANGAVAGGTGGTSSSFSATFPATGTAAGLEYLATPPTLTNGQMVAAQTDVNGNLKVNGGVSQATNSVAINISTATTTQLVALSSGKVIQITSWDVLAAGTGNITLEYGTGSACGTGTTALTGAYNLAAQAGIAKGDGLGPILFVPSGNALCALTSAGVQMSGSVSYLQF